MATKTWQTWNLEMVCNIKQHKLEAESVNDTRAMGVKQASHSYGHVMKPAIDGHMVHGTYKVRTFENGKRLLTLW
jgi:hypothetical protein